MAVYSIVAIVMARDHGGDQFALMAGLLAAPHAQLPVSNHVPHRPGTQTEHLNDLRKLTQAARDLIHITVDLGNLAIGSVGCNNLNESHS
jgi:hypothetical protein